MNKKKLAEKIIRIRIIDELYKIRWYKLQAL